MEKIEITTRILEKLNVSGFSARNLAKDLELDKKTINRHLYAMETLGLVSKQGDSPPMFILINDLKIQLKL